MRTPLIHALTAVVLGALVTAPTYAGSGIRTSPIGKAKSSKSSMQGKVLGKDVIVAPDSSKRPADSRVNGKALDKDLITDPSTRPAANSRVKEVKRAHGVHIKTFSAHRETGRIAIPAFLSNLAKATDENVSYTISRMVGGRWVSVASGRVTVPAGGTKDVSWELKPTNDRVQLKIDVVSDPYAFSTKSYTLKAINAAFLLKYGTNDWVLAYERKGEVDSTRLRADAARKRGAQLAGYGFETKISTKTTTGFFNDTEVVRLLVRTPTTQTRSFDTAEEALEFARTMKSLIHNRVAVWSRVDPE